MLLEYSRRLAVARRACSVAFIAGGARSRNDDRAVSGEHLRQVFRRLFKVTPVFFKPDACRGGCGEIRSHVFSYYRESCVARVVRCASRTSRERAYRVSRAGTLKRSNLYMPARVSLSTCVACELSLSTCRVRNVVLDMSLVGTAAG